MSVLDKLLDAVKLNDDFDDDYLDDEDFDDDYDDEEDDFLEDEKPKKSGGLFGRFGKKKSEDDYLDDEEDDLEDEPLKPAPAKASTGSSFVSKANAADASRYSAPKADRQPPKSNKITPMRNSRKNTSGGANQEVCVIRPSSMEDTRDIADTLLDGSTVILNLEGIDVELAQRIIDFTSGSCYSLGGNLKRISTYIFVLGPHNVDITGDFTSMIEGTAPSVRAGY